MGRFVRRRRSSSRSSRKTHWDHVLWAGTENFEFALGASMWTSIWLKWPGDAFNPNGTVEPSDETLVRTIQNFQVGLGLSALVPGVINPVEVCLGIIAFDGGQYPDFYEGAIFAEGSSFVAPPNPIINASDDWVIRAPCTFVTNGQYQGPADMTFLQSQAKRKLPPGTGILGVIACVDLLSALPPGVVYSVTWAWDARMAVRSGYTR